MSASHLRLVQTALSLPQPVVPLGTRLVDTDFPIGANTDESEQDPHRELLLAQWKWCRAVRRHCSQMVLDWCRFLRLA